MGGDDAHPELYGLKDTSLTKGDISIARDIEQTEYIRDYLDNGKGRVFCICGSMQRAAIADGHGFLPEIAPITGQQHYGEKGPVMLEVVAEPDSELAKAAGNTRFLTSNYHHSGVDAANPRGKPVTSISAYNIEPDGTRGRVVKAIEFPNNAGFATQFHPEFRGSPEEHRIVQYVSQGWKMGARVAPDAIVNCLEKRLNQMLVEPAGGGSAP